MRKLHSILLPCGVHWPHSIESLRSYDVHWKSEPRERWMRSMATIDIVPNKVWRQSLASPTWFILIKVQHTGATSFWELSWTSSSKGKRLRVQLGREGKEMRIYSRAFIFIQPNIDSLHRSWTWFQGILFSSELSGFDPEVGILGAWNAFRNIRIPGLQSWQRAPLT